MLQVSLPLFYGCHREYDTWEKSIENLFVLLNIEKESEKIALAIDCFRSNALNWWKLVSNIYSHYWYRNLDDWHDLRSALRERYAGTNTFDEAKVKLLNCKQNGRSIQSYFEELEGLFLSSEVDENDYMLTDRFHYGLDKCFKQHPKIRRQSRLYEAYYAALEVEREHDTSCGWNGPIEDQGPIKEERMDLDYLCDRELVQKSYDQGEENVINFGVQTKGDEDLIEISAEEYQESLTLEYDGDHLANTNEEGHVAANNGEDEQVEVVNANGGSKDAALKNNPYIRDPLSNIVGPMTRARRKRMNESLNSLIVTTWAKEKIKLEDYKPKTINLLQVTPNGHGPFGEKNFGPQSTKGPPATFPHEISKELEVKLERIFLKRMSSGDDSEQRDDCSQDAMRETLARLYNVTTQLCSRIQDLELEVRNGRAQGNEGLNSRTNSLKEGEYDGDHLANTNEEGHVAANNGEDEQVEVVNANGGSKDAALKNNPYIRDPLSNIVGPMTRARRKRMNESLNSLIVTTWAKEKIKLEDYKPKTINLLQVTPNGHGPFGEKNFGPQSTKGPPATFPHEISKELEVKLERIFLKRMSSGDDSEQRDDRSQDAMRETLARLYNVTTQLCSRIQDLELEVRNGRAQGNEGLNSRTNSLKEGEYDGDHLANTNEEGHVAANNGEDEQVEVVNANGGSKDAALKNNPYIRDPLSNIVGPMTRARRKRMNESLNSLIVTTWAKEKIKLEDYKPKTINLLQVTPNGHGPFGEKNFGPQSTKGPPATFPHEISKELEVKLERIFLKRMSSGDDSEQRDDRSQDAMRETLARLYNVTTQLCSRIQDLELEVRNGRAQGNEGLNSRTNSLKEGEYDGDHLANTNEEGHVAANNGEDEQVEVVNANGGSKDAALKNNPYIRDPLSNIVGPMTRARRKRMNESLNSLIVTTWAKEKIKLEDYKPKTINLLQVTPNGHGPFGEKNFGPQSTKGPPATFPHERRRYLSPQFDFRKCKHKRLQATKAEIQFRPKSHSIDNSVLGMLSHAAGQKKERGIGEDGAAFAYIKRHGWETFSKPLIQPRTQIVQEFYGNFSTAPRDGVFVWGISVNCSTKALRAIWILPRVSQDYRDTLAALHPNQPVEQAVLSRLAKEGADWERDDQDNPLGFPANALQMPDLNLWHHFICCNLMPTSYTAKITYEQALLLYAIVTDTPFDAALVIRDQLTRCITDPKVKSWYFPVMITMLCRRAEVTFLSTDIESSLQQPLRLSKLDQRPPGASSLGRAAFAPTPAGQLRQRDFNKQTRFILDYVHRCQTRTDENHIAFHGGSPSEGNELILHSRFGMPSLLCRPIKEERMDLDYLCDRELVQESYDQGDENVINFGVQTKGDEDLMEISAEEYQESLTLCAP
ncbi:OLC1v1005284C1 [Oldenlandia corymbosa var. corymbosa]|uniref:OLC1v1005284C1 n=1 Tax=Oldenlandia corymbosa var. corymbosa TaxID=529605 RepID=A0AAV1DEA3_OLDCO|nr:OLC1v1005284C1 [Oldenlandia corymbosa var. corymbosa]